MSDPLLDLFGSSQPVATQSVVSQPSVSVPTPVVQSGGGGGLMDLLGGDLLMTQPPAPCMFIGVFCGCVKVYL